MLEVMKLLRERFQKTYIVTGASGIRRTPPPRHGVPPDQDRIEPPTKYEMRKSRCSCEPRCPFITGGKPVAINLFIGKRPIAAFGNSSGDAEMLAWTAASGRGGTRLMVLVHHDDAHREYAYGPAGGLPDTKVGTFPYALMDEAKAGRWHVVSMKNDWKQIFAFEQLAMTDKRAADSESRP
jgi:hypothetical protein